MKKTYYSLVFVLFCSCSYYHYDQEELQEIENEKTFWHWNEGRVHYVEAGKGKRHIVLLHGFGANTYTWKNQIAMLVDSGFHVWVIDFLGFGLSDKPIDTEYTIELYQRQIGDFLKEKKIKKTHVIANSMGGAVALALASRNSEKISSMILIDPLAYPTKMPFFYSVGKAFGKLAIPFFSRSLVHQTLKKIYYDPKKITKEQIDAYWLPYQMEGGREVVVNILRSFEQNLLEELRKSYTKMKMPICIIWGEEDKWIPLSHLRLLLEDFPHAEHMTIPFSGHAPQEESPEITNKKIKQFLAKPQFRHDWSLQIEDILWHRQASTPKKKESHNLF